MKKRLIWGLSILGVLLLLIGLFFILSMPVSKQSKKVTFVVSKGDNKIEIISNLSKANIIKSKYVGFVYVFLKPNINFQAGKYKIDKSDSTSEIINQIANGETNYTDTVTLTFVEGKTIDEYADLIDEKLDVSKEEFISLVNNKDFLAQLIDKYWFLDTSILNDKLYFPLEGYLYPDTYVFYKNASSKDIIYELLNNEEKHLNLYKKQIKASKMSMHQLLAIASIAELEASNKEDRAKVSQVIYTRLELGISLGMDVTTYYGVHKTLKDGITAADLADENDYNTRNVNFEGLPVGPVCNPSIESLDAALNPSKTDYQYFYADMETGKVYFAKTYEDFAKIREKIG